MTIESITVRTQTPPTLKTSPKAESDGGKEAAVNNAGKKDSIVITAIAQGIKKSFESSSVTVVDAGRVASVKKALADGSYQVNAEKIAEKMLRYEKLMP